MRLFSVAITAFLRVLFLIPFLRQTTTTLAFGHANAAPVQDIAIDSETAGAVGRNVSIELFLELEELARIVDISYCVGGTGIHKPFSCLSRCSDFPSFELVDTWNTGPLLSDSCGYVALDHGKRRVVVAFRGTYSVANTIVDLTTVPQEYVPYPGDPDEPEAGKERGHSWWDWLPHFGRRLIMKQASITHDHDLPASRLTTEKKVKCANCTVHSGFLHSWLNTRTTVLINILLAKARYPAYAVHLVGHSLGGAVAALAGLELDVKGLNPTVTTFGEPRIGNVGLRDYLDAVFGLDARAGEEGARYRRVTHRADPVPLLPLTEWGYRMHAGEVYISKKHLSPEVTDLEVCEGDEDAGCIAQGEPRPNVRSEDMGGQVVDADVVRYIREQYDRLAEGDRVDAESWGIPARLKMWQLFFAHRDYFWRLGLCVPGGDPGGGWLGKSDVQAQAQAVDEL